MAKKRAVEGCVIKALPAGQEVRAAHNAYDINPANYPRVDKGTFTPQELAVLSTKFWGAGGVALGVSFLDSPSAGVRDRILDHMNAWGETANMVFRWSFSGGEVRIDRGSDGYWSYLGTDILLMPKNAATMNLQGITLTTPEEECRRSIRHETGHTAGFPHEHLRRALISRLDESKTENYYAQHYGWSALMTRQNVLTPIEERAIIATPAADETSIMTYPIAGECTRNGQPIKGGLDINNTDRWFAGQLYPKAAPPAPAAKVMTLTVDVKAGSYTLTPAPASRAAVEMGMAG